MIISIYAALLALMFLYLSIVTIIQRRREGVAIGTNDIKSLVWAKRAHANFNEYVPLCLILLCLLEFSQTSSLIIHSLGIILIIGRALHAYGFLYRRRSMTYRISGMIMTFTVLIASSIGLLANTIIN